MEGVGVLKRCLGGEGRPGAQTLTQIADFASLFKGPFTHAIFDAAFVTLFNAILLHSSQLHHYILPIT